MLFLFSTSGIARQEYSVLDPTLRDFESRSWKKKKYRLQDAAEHVALQSGVYLRKSDSTTESQDRVRTEE